MKIASFSIHLLLLFAMAPLLSGLIAKVKALIAGRKGPPVLQLYYDLARLFRKNMVISSTTTWVFRTGPVVSMMAAVLCALLIPFGPFAAPISFTGDPILFVYLLALSRFFTVLAALDTGSSFEGMGAAREATFSILVEPTIFVIFIVLARNSGHFTMDRMFSPIMGDMESSTRSVGLLLICFCLFIVLLAENCRIPFDDPNTHLELTMIHEVMVLDHSGPDFGLILYGAAMKLLLFSTLIANLLLPMDGDLLTGTISYLLLVSTIACSIGLVESGMARLRLVKVPQLLVGASLLSFFALILILR